MTGLCDNPHVLAFHRLLYGTPSLVARLYGYQGRSEAALARALDPGAPVTARLAAGQIIAVLRILAMENWRRMDAGRAPPRSTATRWPRPGWPSRSWRTGWSSRVPEEPFGERGAVRGQPCLVAVPALPAAAVRERAQMDGAAVAHPPLGEGAGRLGGLLDRGEKPGALLCRQAVAVGEDAEPPRRAGVLPDNRTQ